MNTKPPRDFTAIRKIQPSVFIKDVPTKVPIAKSIVGKVSFVCKTDLSRCSTCWYDTEPLPTPTADYPNFEPVRLPRIYHHSTNTFITEGVFCSCSCAVSYAKERLHGPDVGESIQLLYAILQKSGNLNIINPSPHWSLLQKFGGCLTIEQFRKNTDKFQTECPKSRFIAGGYSSYLFDQTDPVELYKSLKDSDDKITGIEIPEHCEPDRCKLPSDPSKKWPKRINTTQYAGPVVGSAQFAKKITKKITDSRYKRGVNVKKQKTNTMLTMLGVEKEKKIKKAL